MCVCVREEIRCLRVYLCYGMWTDQVPVCECLAAHGYGYVSVFG